MTDTFTSHRDCPLYVRVFSVRAVSQQAIPLDRISGSRRYEERISSSSKNPNPFVRRNDVKHIELVAAQNRSKGATMNHDFHNIGIVIKDRCRSRPRCTSVCDGTRLSLRYRCAPRAVLAHRRYTREHFLGEAEYATALIEVLAPMAARRHEFTRWTAVSRSHH